MTSCPILTKPASPPSPRTDLHSREKLLVGAALIHAEKRVDGRKDRRTDIAKLIGALFTAMPTRIKYYILLPENTYKFFIDLGENNNYISAQIK